MFVIRADFYDNKMNKRCVGENQIIWEEKRSEAIDKARTELPVIFNHGKNIASLVLESTNLAGCWVLLSTEHGFPIWSWDIDMEGVIIKERCEYAP